MDDVLHEKPEHNLFFGAFANDLGSQLDRLKLEYEAIENGTIMEEPEETDDETDSAMRQNRGQKLRGSIASDVNEPKDRTRTYTVTLQRAFSSVSLMANFKTNFWKRKHGKNKHRGDESSHDSTSSSPERNNNRQDMPSIKINGESEGNEAISAAEPKSSKSAKRSQTMSPSRLRPSSRSSEPEQMENKEPGKIFVPPVIIDGRVTHEYQYVTPESSPSHKSTNVRRSNSFSRILRIVKSPKKSPKNDRKVSPIKALYEKTVLTASANDLYKSTLASSYLSKTNGTPTKSNRQTLKDGK